MALIIITGKVYLGYVPTGKFLDLRNHVCVCELLFLLATILRLWEAILANFSKLSIAKQNCKQWEV